MEGRQQGAAESLEVVTGGWEANKEAVSIGENPEAKAAPEKATEMLNGYRATDEALTISKGVDDGTDVSGDYNEYESEKEIGIQNCNVTIKGNGGTVNSAVWATDGYAYALNVSPGISEEEIIKIVNSILDSQ